MNIVAALSHRCKILRSQSPFSSAPPPCAIAAVCRALRSRGLHSPINGCPIYKSKNGRKTGKPYCTTRGVLANNGSSGRMDFGRVICHDTGSVPSTGHRKSPSTLAAGARAAIGLQPMFGGTMDSFEDNFRGLMRRVAEGSEEAAREIVEKCGNDVRQAVRRALDTRLRSKFDSLDFVQIVWLTLFRNRGRVVDFQRPEDLVAFLVAVARRNVVTENRRRLGTGKYSLDRERGLDAPTDGGVGPRSNEPAPLDLAVARERWRASSRKRPCTITRSSDCGLRGRRTKRSPLNCTSQNAPCAHSSRGSSIRRTLGDRLPA